MQQGSQQVSSNHSSAFPIAAVITGMWSSFPDVGDLILAQFYDQCPFLVPFYIPRAAELTDAEYFASLGYQCSEGEIEEQDKFLKRMTGLVRLYAAVISSIPPSGQTNQHPYGLSNGWTWLSRMLNLEPRPDFTATAIYEFLAVAGHALMRKYKKPFWKVAQHTSGNLCTQDRESDRQGTERTCCEIEGVFRSMYQRSEDSCARWPSYSTLVAFTQLLKPPLKKYKAFLKTNM